MRPRQIEVEPIYGWGWFMPGRPRDYFPPRFEIELDLIEADEWKGIVTTPGHEFAGARVAFSQRHNEWDGLVNIAVHPSGNDAAEITGFASGSLMAEIRLRFVACPLSTHCGHPPHRSSA